MPSPLTLKLQNFARFSDQDLRALDALANINIRRLRAREDIVREGDDIKFVHLLLDGWAYRHKTLKDGRRQIIALMVPGDLCDPDIFLLKEMDHSLAALTPARFARLPREALDRFAEAHAAINRALRRDTLVMAAIQREWTVSLGQRSAFERLAHLFCELLLRLGNVALVRNNSFELPLTQHELAELTGITPVHVNRTLQQLRARNLIRWKGREFYIPDVEALKGAALFSSDYLHCGHEGVHVDVR